MGTDDKRNIILTGFMGTGKTTVGKLLACLLDREYIDTDELLQVRHKRSIPEIFAELGEAAFRKMEADLARELADREELVISTGGRMMLDPVNVAALSRKGRIFCLVATPDEILRRIRDDSDHPRPLLDVPKPDARVVELLRQRQQKYLRFSQVMTDGKRAEEVARDLVDLVQSGSKGLS